MINSWLYASFLIVVAFAQWVIFIRFMLQMSQMSPKHPIIKSAYTLSSIVDIFAQIFPNLAKGRISVAALVLLWILNLLKYAGIGYLRDYDFDNFQLFFIGTTSGILLFLSMLRWSIIAGILISLIASLTGKMHPLFEVLMRVADPIIEPFRRFVPPLGMLDLAPLAAILLLSLVSTIVQILFYNMWAML